MWPVPKGSSWMRWRSRTQGLPQQRGVLSAGPSTRLQHTISGLLTGEGSLDAAKDAVNALNKVLGSPEAKTVVEATAKAAVVLAGVLSVRLAAAAATAASSFVRVQYDTARYQATLATMAGVSRTARSRDYCNERHRQGSLRLNGASGRPCRDTDCSRHSTDLFRNEKRTMLGNRSLMSADLLMSYPKSSGCWVAIKRLRSSPSTLQILNRQPKTRRMHTVR